MAIEPRDPFADRRLIEFCTSLPEEQFEDGGWPKIILRRASAGLVPDPVRWRLGKEHLGGLFNDVLWRSDIAALDASQLANLQSYVSGDTLTNTLESGRTGSAWDSTVARLLALRYGSTWLKSISSATR
jgi:asparagine synthase (glutamine-hydrolysing)